MIKALGYKTRFKAALQLLFKPKAFNERLVSASKERTNKEVRKAVNESNAQNRKEFDQKLEILLREDMRKGITTSKHAFTFMKAPVLGIDTTDWRQPVTVESETRQVEQLRLSFASRELGIDRFKLRAAHALAEHLIDNQFIFGEYNRHHHVIEFKVNLFS